MNGWIAPALASATWAGLLAQPSLAGDSPVCVWLIAGLVLLGVALALAPARTRSMPALEAAGLVRRDRDQRLLEPVTPARSSGPGPRAWGAAGLALLAVFMISVGWGSAH